MPLRCHCDLWRGPQTLDGCNVNLLGRIYSRPERWHFTGRIHMLVLVIRSHGAPSIAQGRTPHEVQDELCMAADLGRATA